MLLVRHARSTNSCLFSKAARSVASTVEGALQTAQTSLADALGKHPEGAAKLIVKSLSQAHRQALLSALNHNAEQELTNVRSLNQAYVDQLFQRVDINRPDGLLDKQELQLALKADRELAHNASKTDATPSTAALCTVAVAAGVPFVGFGFLDNFIMIIAGDAIDATLCAKLGFTTMAAAGLGNLVSDVAGIGLAEQIEVYARKMKWCREPPLSEQQRRLAATRTMRFVGASVGVSIGCLLGMAPLLFISRAASVLT